MINLRNIIGHEISGLDSDDMTFLAKIAENSSEPVNQFNGSTKKQYEEIYQEQKNNGKFEDLSLDVQNEINNLEESFKSKSTENQTKNFVRKFQIFLDNKGIPSKIDSMPLRYLTQYLRWFYSQLRKDDGGLYAPNSLFCIRSASYRHFLFSRNIDIIKDPQFSLSNNTFKAIIAKYLNENSFKQLSTGNKFINDEDLYTMRRYFDRTTPEKLQQEIFYNIVSHFGLRGREWLRNDIKKSNIMINIDSAENEYVDIIFPNKQKNVTPESCENNKQSLMYATPDNPEQCPVVAMKAYLTKLPNDTDIFFLKPKLHPKRDETCWFYSKCPIGKNKLADMMSIISERANLSQRYTNHCIRATVVTTLLIKDFLPLK